MHPILFTLGSLTVPTFYAFVLTAFLTGYAALHWAAGRRGISPEALTMTMVAAFFGGALGTHVLAGLVAWLSAGQTAGVFGWGLSAMTDTGGFLFGELAVVAAALWSKARPLAVLDAWAFAAVSAIPIGRLGCLMAGCCYGAPTTLPWGLHYPPDHPGAVAAHGMALHPTPLYMSLGMVAVWVLLRRRLGAVLPDGLILLFAWSGYALVRGFVEVWRGDADRGAWFGGAVTSYQLIVLVAALLHALIVWRSVRRQRPEPVSVPHR